MRTRQVRSRWHIVRCKKIAKRRPQRGRLFCCEFRRAAQRYKFARTNAEWHAPVGADASVRPAVCTHENECTDAIAYTVCRGRCPHRPAQRTSVFYDTSRQICRCPNGRTEASAPLPKGEPRGFCKKFLSSPTLERFTTHAKAGMLILKYTQCQPDRRTLL